jgi:hypothetical protein
MDYERIALWVIILVLLFKVFVIKERYTPTTPLGIMDLKEFSGLPDDIKQIWQDNIINKILPTVGTKITEAWDNTSSARKTAIKNEFSTAATQLKTNIDNTVGLPDGL